MNDIFLMPLKWFTQHGITSHLVFLTVDIYVPKEEKEIVVVNNILYIVFEPKKIIFYIETQQIRHNIKDTVLALYNLSKL